MTAAQSQLEQIKETSLRKSEDILATKVDVLKLQLSMDEGQISLKAIHAYMIKRFNQITLLIACLSIVLAATIIVVAKLK